MLFSFSSDFIIDGVTVVDNLFIHEYLPEAKPVSVKVYIYGLYAANHGGIDGVDELSRKLSLTIDETFEALQELELAGLISIVSKTPPSIRFLNPRGKDAPSRKKYKPSKYADFISALEKLFSGRTMSQNELLEYVDAVERLNMQPETMLMIASYCINGKGQSISFKYVLTVAEAWANEGVREPAAAEEKIRRLELLTGDIKRVLDALGKKTPPDFAQREMLSKWTKAWGFPLASVLFTAKKCKSKGHGINKLDAMLEEYHKLNIHSVLEIDEYSARRDALYSLAVEINKKLGLYYESLDNMVATYIVKWREMGFDADALLTLANYCFLKELRRLSDLDSMVSKFHKMGRLTTVGINQYIDGLVRDDEFIRRLYSALSLNKFVTQPDRETVAVWQNAWGLSGELILFAADAANGKTHPMAYLNQILSDYKQNGVTTVEKAKEHAQNNQSKPKRQKTATADDFTQRKYSKEELDALSIDLNDIDKLEW
ncbi:MAG: DnaD domain protein [Clostridiales bacterium]|nr:DnaD domain protein [Clostridiales bacterium]